MPQVDLFGKRKRAFRFGRMFRKAGRHDSPAEGRIADFLGERGVGFRAHARIIPARLAKTLRFPEEEKLGIVRSGLSGERLDLVLKKANLEKIHPELFRSDFLVEGLDRNGKRKRVFIEYFGLWNPKVPITNKSMRKRHTRQVAIYTFVKFPLKRALYGKSGAETVFLFPGETANLERKLKKVLELRQDKTTLGGWG